jgi:hypothetical protein
MADEMPIPASARTSEMAVSQLRRDGLRFVRVIMFLPVRFLGARGGAPEPENLHRHPLCGSSPVFTTAKRPLLRRKRWAWTNRVPA